MNTSDIASRIKLATLSTGAWRATRLNSNESAIVNKAHGTGKAAKVSVRLSNHPALDALAKLHAEAYVEHTRLTLPSVQDGMRLLPAGREFEHSSVMRKLGGKHNALMDEFLDAYPDEKDTAPTRLNGLYVASQWPDIPELREKFQFKTRYLSCPTEGTWGAWLDESKRAAEDELTDRLKTALQHLADRCKDDGKLYQSVFSNLQDIVSLVPDLNLTRNPTITSVAINSVDLAKLDADELRDNKAARKLAADKASNILKAFGGR